MNSVEIVKPGHNFTISENMVKNKAIALDNSVSALQQQIIEQGLGDKVEFNGCNVIMDVDSFASIFGVYAVGQKKLIDEKDEHIDSLKDNLDDTRGTIQDLRNGMMDLRDMVSKCKSEDRLTETIAAHDKTFEQNQRTIYNKLSEIQESLSSGTKTNSDEIISELISIIKLQDEKLDSVVNEVRTLAKRNEDLVNHNRLFIEFIIDEIKSIAVGYAMKHNPKKGKENPHYKGLTDENVRTYFAKCNGNIAKMVKAIKEELNLEYTWVGIDRRVRKLGLK